MFWGLAGLSILSRDPRPTGTNLVPTFFSTNSGVMETYKDDLLPRLFFCHGTGMTSREWMSGGVTTLCEVRGGAEREPFGLCAQEAGMQLGREPPS